MEEDGEEEEQNHSKIDLSFFGQEIEDASARLDLVAWLVGVCMNINLKIS